MKVRVCFCIVILLCLLHTTHSYSHEKVVVVPLASSASIPLAQAELEISTNRAEVLQSVNIKFARHPDNNITTPAQEVLFDFPVSEDSRTTVVRYDETTGTSFLDFKNILTNGEADFLRFSVFASSQSTSFQTIEEGWFSGGFVNDLIPDLQGTVITHILLSIDTVSLNSPGTDQNNDGIWTDIFVKMRFIIFGKR